MQKNSLSCWEALGNGKQSGLSIDGDMDLLEIEKFDQMIIMKLYKFMEENNL